MQRSVTYTMLFATGVCLVCAVFVASSAVSLRSRQDRNVYLDKQKNVLVAAGLAKDSEVLTAQEIEKRFQPVTSVVVDLESGNELSDVDPKTFDQRKAVDDPKLSRPAPQNTAGITRLPLDALVYKMEESGKLKLLILPIEGKGLWSTLYGFIALDSDLETIRGITFYEHKETPGLGGEVDNPKWKALWAGRRAFGDDLEPKIAVIHGKAGPPQQDPYEVDGLSGATMTSRGVTHLVQFWLGDEGFGPYLKKLRASTSATSTTAASLGAFGERSDH
jgi:Na+-transporting NADH:ubiquinone oxidoreductase subunit C